MGEISITTITHHSMDLCYNCHYLSTKLPLHKGLLRASLMAADIVQVLYIGIIKELALKIVRTKKKMRRISHNEGFPPNYQRLDSKPSIPR